MKNKSNKTINICKAACGSGKTEMLVSNINEMLDKANILISVPTIELSISIKDRIKSKHPKISVSNLNSKTIIDSDTPTHITAQAKIDSLPERAFDRNQIIIVTNQTLSKLNISSHSNWIVVIDEVPNLIEFYDFTFKPFEASLIEKYIEVNDGEVIEMNLKKNQFNELTSKSTDGILSKSAKNLLILIKKSLSSGEPVFHSINSNEKHCYHSIQFNKAVLDIFHNSLETHILCANINASMSDIALRHHNFVYNKSYLTPLTNKHKNTDLVNIYPLLKKGKSFSKSFVNKKDKDDDLILNSLLNNTKKILKEDFIYVINNWAIDDSKFKSLESKELNIQRIKYDLRGNNDFRSISKIAFIASAKPNPLQSNNISRLSEITGFTREYCLSAWDISYAYEMAYQAAARTCVRTKNNTKEVIIVVPDYNFVKYIKEQFLNAKVNEAYAVDFETLDLRKNSDSKKNIIKNLISEGYNCEQVQQQQKISSKTFYKYREELILEDIKKGYNDDKIREQYKGIQKGFIKKLRLMP
jgi:hypothetical protein